MQALVRGGDPGDWVDDQLADIEAKRHAKGPGSGVNSPVVGGAAALRSGAVG